MGRDFFNWLPANPRYAMYKLFLHCMSRWITARKKDIKKSLQTQKQVWRVSEYFTPRELSVRFWDPPMHEWEPLTFCHAPCYSKWGFRVNDKGLRLRWSASLTQNPPLSGGSQAKVRLNLFCEPPVPLRELVEPIHNQIWIPWRGIISVC